MNVIRNVSCCLPERISLLTEATYSLGLFTTVRERGLRVAKNVGISPQSGTNPENKLSNVLTGERWQR